MRERSVPSAAPSSSVMTPSAAMAQSAMPAKPSASLSLSVEPDPRTLSKSPMCRPRGREAGRANEANDADDTFRAGVVDADGRDYASRDGSRSDDLRAGAGKSDYLSQLR